jgi:hypothetical protein
MSGRKAGGSNTYRMAEVEESILTSACSASVTEGPAFISPNSCSTNSCSTNSCSNNSHPTNAGGANASAFECNGKVVQDNISRLSGHLDWLVDERLKNLPEIERVVLSFYYYDLLSPKRISELLRLPEHEVKSLHDQALRTLRSSLKLEQ